MAETPGRRNIFAEYSAVRPPAPGPPVPVDSPTGAPVTAGSPAIQRAPDPRIEAARPDQPVQGDPAKSIPQVVAEDLIADYDREADARPDLSGWGK